MEMRCQRDWEPTRGNAGGTILEIALVDEVQ